MQSWRYKGQRSRFSQKMAGVQNADCQHSNLRAKAIHILCVRNAAPMVGLLFSLKSLDTNRRTREDFPTAASPIECDKSIGQQPEVGVRRQSRSIQSQIPWTVIKAALSLKRNAGSLSPKALQFAPPRLALTTPIMRPSSPALCHESLSSKRIHLFHSEYDSQFACSPSAVDQPSPMPALVPPRKRHADSLSTDRGLWRMHFHDWPECSSQH